MSDDFKDQVRSWGQVIIPVAVAAIGQLSVVLTQINSLDKNLALANERLENQIESNKDSQARITLLTEKVGKLQYSDEKIADLRVRIEAFDSRLVAVKTQLNLVEERMIHRDK